tara:strand:- start:389 stop:697 length:309 start_codon:yes stop_codon:yes gene_type:complete
MKGTVIFNGGNLEDQKDQMGSTNSTVVRHDDRPITGTGVYEFSQKFENLELNDSDNYSDEDFYSDEFEEVDDQEYDDREDDDFAFGDTVKKQVDIYQQYLGE